MKEKLDVFYFDLDLKPILILETDKVSFYQETAQLNGQITSTLTTEYKSEIEHARYFGSRDVDQPNEFVIYRIIDQEKSNYQITSQGIHLIFDELKSEVVRDVRPNSTGAGALESVLSNANSKWQIGFNYSSNRPVQANYYYQSVLSAFWEIIELGKLEFKPRITFNGSEITGRYIDLYDQVSDDYGKFYESDYLYSSNGRKLVSVTENIGHSEIYTALIPRGKGEQVGDGYGRAINIEDVEWSISNGDPLDKPLGQDYIELPSATAEHGFKLGVIEFSEIEDPELLIIEAYESLLVQSRPRREFRANIFEIGHVEYGETIGIVENNLNIRYKTRVFELTRDFLNSESKTAKFGDKVTVTTAERVKQQERDTAQKIQTQTESIYERIVNEIIIDYNNEDAYTYELEIDNEYGLPAGTYSYDAPIDQNPTKVVYFGAGRILIANSKLPNGEWNWRLALDGDGLSAEMVNTLQLNADQIFIGTESMPLDERIALITGQLEIIDGANDANYNRVLEQAQQYAEEYADAQTNAEQIRADAYADNILTSAEHRAVLEAEDALIRARQEHEQADAALQKYLQEQIEAIDYSTYIQTTAEGDLLLGKNSSRVKTIISNDGVHIGGSKESAFTKYIDGVTIVDHVDTEKLSIGKFTFNPRPDGGLTIDWEG